MTKVKYRWGSTEHLSRRICFLQMSFNLRDVKLYTKKSIFNKLKFSQGQCPDVVIFWAKHDIFWRSSQNLNWVNLKKAKHLNLIIT